MNHTVGLKELREQTPALLRRIKAGETLVVMRRSTPLFKISPLDEDGWETVIDFTKFRKGGIQARELLEKLKAH